MVQNYWNDLSLETALHHTLIRQVKVGEDTLEVVPLMLVHSLLLHPHTLPNLVAHFLH